MYRLLTDVDACATDAPCNQAQPNLQCHVKVWGNAQACINMLSQACMNMLSKCCTTTVVDSCKQMKEFPCLTVIWG